MVDAADWPDEGVGPGPGWPLDRPATGSAFEDGHRPLWGFFLTAPAVCSPVVTGISPFDCGGGTGMVKDVVEEEEDEEGAVEDVEDEEFVLCALLRGMNIRVTSSAFIECNRPCPASPGSH